MKSADMIAKIDELIKGPVYHIDIFPCTVHPKHDNRCVEVEKFFQHNRKEIDKKFVNILLKLYCYYDFCVSAWVSKHEVFENPDLDRLISLIEHCFEGEWEARDYINIVLPELNLIRVASPSPTSTKCTSNADLLIFDISGFNLSHISKYPLIINVSNKNIVKHPYIISLSTVFLFNILHHMFVYFKFSNLFFDNFTINKVFNTIHFKNSSVVSFHNHFINIIKFS